jgi:hypothetical protein
MFWLSTALFVWYLVTYVLLPIPAVRPGLDESWRAFLTWAFEHGRQFGTEVIFTYGPWGFLVEPRGTVSVYPWQVVGRLVLAIAGSSGTALLGVSWIRSVMARWIWAAAIVILAEPSTLIPVLLFLGTMPSGVEFRFKRPVLLLVAFAAGLAACTKFTCFLLVVALMPLMLMRKGLATLVSTSVASFLLFWLVAGQGLSNLPAFVRQSMEISSGYASAMVAGRPSIELLLALSLCGLPLLRLTGQIMPPVNLGNLGRLGWLAICEFLIFRHGLIRNDPPHWYMAFITVGVPIGILLIPLPGGTSWFWPSHWNAAYRILFLGTAAVMLPSVRWTVEERIGIFVESFRLFPVYARELRSLGPREGGSPADAGSMDVFPHELSYAIQKGLPLRNRPVIQAYSAYTKNLCEKNAAFLEGPNAPRTIYFHSAPIDKRYPTMEDALAWRSLLTHYSPSSVADEYLVLKHRERPIDYELKPILDRSMRTDVFLEIPSVPGGLIWAQLQVQRTLTGRLLDLLYRNEKLVLRVETARRSLDFTLLDETTAGGFLLSPWVNSQASMLELFQPESQRVSAENVRRILVQRGKLPSLGFGRDVKIRLYALVMRAPAQDIPGGLIQDLGRTLRAERPVSSVQFSPMVTLKGGEVRLVVGSPSSGWILLQTGRSLRVRYGIDGTRSTCSGDVSFRILLGDGAMGERRLLWEDLRQADAGTEWSAENTVRLPDAAGQQSLYFETRSAERSCGAEGAYWSNLRIEP